jgi:hypothetical protein
MNWYKVALKLNEEAKAKRLEVKTAALNKRPQLLMAAEVLESLSRALRTGMGMK